MFKVITVMKKLVFVGVFVAIFFTFGATQFQQSVILLLYLIYVCMPRNDDIFRGTLANILILNYFKKNDDGTDEELSKATSSFLAQMQSEVSLLHITEANPQEVVDIDNAQVIAGLVEWLVFFALLASLIVTIF